MENNQSVCNEKLRQSVKTVVEIDTNIDSIAIIEIDFSRRCSISISWQRRWLRKEIFIAKDVICFPRQKIRGRSRIFCYVRQSAIAFLYFSTPIFTERRSSDIAFSRFLAYRRQIPVIIISHLFLNRNIYHELCRNSQERKLVRERASAGINHSLLCSLLFSHRRPFRKRRKSDFEDLAETYISRNHVLFELIVFQNLPFFTSFE